MQEARNHWMILHAKKMTAAVMFVICFQVLLPSVPNVRGSRERQNESQLLQQVGQVRLSAVPSGRTSRRDFAERARLETTSEPLADCMCAFDQRMSEDRRGNAGRGFRLRGKAAQKRDQFRQSRTNERPTKNCDNMADGVPAQKEAGRFTRLLHGSSFFNKTWYLAHHDAQRSRERCPFKVAPSDAFASS